VYAGIHFDFDPSLMIRLDSWLRCDRGLESLGFGSDQVGESSFDVRRPLARSAVRGCKCLVLQPHGLNRAEFG
jgi:hypothetical protein